MKTDIFSVGQMAKMLTGAGFGAMLEGGQPYSVTFHVTPAEGGFGGTVEVVGENGSQTFVLKNGKVEAEAKKGKSKE